MINLLQENIEVKSRDSNQKINYNANNIRQY